MSKKIQKLTLGVLACAMALGLQAKQIIDVAGRTVEVKDEVKTMVLGEGRMVYALSILEKNPVKGVLAWGRDLAKNDHDTLVKITEKFPEAKNIKDLGDPYASDINLENIITLKPDVFVLNMDNFYKATESHLIDKLAKVGIPTVFIDFRQHPTENTVPSMMILGDLLNKQQKANEFINYYRQQMAKVTNITNKIKEKDRPLVFIENAAGLTNDCCTTYGQQNFGKYISLAGGRNWGATKSSGFKVKVNPEAIFSQDFDVIIGTGANWKASYDGAKSVSLGYFAKENEIQKEIKLLSERKGWQELKAVKNHKFYSIYHQYYNSPYHFIAVQVFAKWIHPELFKDLDPVANYKEFYKKFLPIDYTGYFWTEVK